METNAHVDAPKLNNNFTSRMARSWWLRTLKSGMALR